MKIPRAIKNDHGFICEILPHARHSTRNIVCSLPYFSFRDRIPKLKKKKSFRICPGVPGVSGHHPCAARFHASVKRGLVLPFRWLRVRIECVGPGMLANLAEAKVILQITVGELSRRFRKIFELGFLLALC